MFTHRPLPAKMLSPESATSEDRLCHSVVTFGTSVSLQVNHVEELEMPYPYSRRIIEV
jgi:hypothetical protein